MAKIDSADLPNGRAKLTLVIRCSGDTVNIRDVAKELHINRVEASKLLSRWAWQGWLRRVGPGIYVPVPLDSLASEHVIDDPWILVPALFGPAYVGGWSAAEYWGLTEQIFREIVVISAQNVRAKKKEVHGATFLLRHIPEKNIFGTKTVWRGQTEITVSDIHRTILDMFNDPSLGGGIQHAFDCFLEYLKHKKRDIPTLISYADRLGNGAIFKRMGFLAERSPNGQGLVEHCRSRITKGNAKLDPALTCPNLITRWRLRVPRSWVYSDKL